MQDRKIHQQQNKSTEELPPIPNKIYFTIGEVSNLCELRPHVLRYWEQEFPQLRPTKRRGNRRYYQHNDVMLVRQIKDLLYNQGYTIEGARLQLNNEVEGKISGTQARAWVSETITELQSILEELES